MKDQLIKFETAKIAKKKGFDIPTYTAYIGGEFHENESEPNGYDGYDLASTENWNMEGLVFTKDGSSCFGCQNNPKYFEGCTATTQSLLQRFIRETRGVHIEIHRNGSGYYWSMCKEDSGTDLGWSEYRGPNDSGVWDKFEDALEDALFVQLSYDVPDNIKVIKHWGNYVQFAIKSLK
jgi:hypothetical protein